MHTQSALVTGVESVTARDRPTTGWIDLVMDQNDKDVAFWSSGAKESFFSYYPENSKTLRDKPNGDKAAIAGKTPKKRVCRWCSRDAVTTVAHAIIGEIPCCTICADLWVKYA